MMIPEQGLVTIKFGPGAQMFTVIDKLLMIVLDQVLLHYIMKHKYKSLHKFLSEAYVVGIH